MAYKTRKAPPKGRQRRKPRKNRELCPEYLAACELVGIEPPDKLPGHMSYGDLAEHRLAVWAAWQCCRGHGATMRGFAEKCGTYHQKVLRRLEGLIPDAHKVDEPDAHELVWAVYDRVDGKKVAPLAQSVIARAMKQVGIVKEA